MGDGGMLRFFSETHGCMCIYTFVWLSLVNSEDPVLKPVENGREKCATFESEACSDLQGATVYSCLFDWLIALSFLPLTAADSNRRGASWRPGWLHPSQA